MRPSSVAVGGSFAKIVSPTISQHTSTSRLLIDSKYLTLELQLPSGPRLLVVGPLAFGLAGLWPLCPSNAHAV